jgi:hypothetical protein
MQADTSPGSCNLVKFRREFEALYRGVDQQAVWDRIMEFYATTFDNVHDVMRRNEPLYRSVVYLRERGYRILLTTNPIFPQLATYKRLAMAVTGPQKSPLSDRTQTVPSGMLAALVKTRRMTMASPAPAYQTTPRTNTTRTTVRMRPTCFITVFLHHWSSVSP